MSARAVPAIAPAKRTPSPVGNRLTVIADTVKGLRGIAVTADRQPDPTAFRRACTDDLDMIEQALARISREIERAIS